jgi:hypothetical protein
LHPLADLIMGRGVGGLADGVCPKADDAVASTSVAVNKETTFIRKLRSQMQSNVFAETRRQACTLGKSRVRVRS